MDSEVYNLSYQFQENDAPNINFESSFAKEEGIERQPKAEHQDTDSEKGIISINLKEIEENKEDNEGILSLSNFYLKFRSNFWKCYHISARIRRPRPKEIRG